MTERHTKILEALEKRERVEVSFLAQALNVSQVTVRKDLRVLEDRGFIRREHGYASLESLDDEQKSLVFQYGLKRRIAQAAAETVENGETVMIESGPCCALLAEELAHSKKDITIVTNSVFIAGHVRDAPYGKIILLGGYYQRDSQVLVGAITRKCAEVFFSDKLFIGADGFSERLGFTGRDHNRALTVRALAKQAEQIIVLTESDKFNAHGVVGLVDVGEVSQVYTDDRIPRDTESFLRERRVTVHKVRAPAGSPVFLRRHFQHQEQREMIAQAEAVPG